MTKFEEEVKPIATVEMKATSDGNEINFHCKTGLSDYLLSKGNADLYLKSQLQQQALPVVPKLTQKQADILNDYKNGSGSLAKYLSVEIKKRDYDYFARAWLDGYTVEKPQLFYLKNKITGRVLVYDDSPELSEVSELFATGGEFELENYTFTQEEIDSMETGSYEQIEVTE